MMLSFNREHDMRSRSQPAALCLAFALTIGLSACGGGDTAANNASAAATDAQPAGVAAAPKEAKAVAPTLADGPDVCFRAIAKHLGPDTKVSEIISFFSSGSEIDSGDREPQGELTSCTVQYQNPSDPRKLVGTRLDIATGKFDPPSPVEISVMGNAAKFNLEDHLIPLSQVNAAGLTAIMDAQKAKLSGVYSRYAWSGVRLTGPDGFSNTHKLRLDVEGRLASNDIKSGGYASITTDAKKVTTNFLLP
jgi:hypothetical protein